MEIKTLRFFFVKVFPSKFIINKKLFSVSVVHFCSCKPSFFEVINRLGRNLNLNNYLKLMILILTENT